MHCLENCFGKDKMEEECGVFGIYNVENAAQLTYYGLHSLQHRGQQGAGIATSDNGHILRHRGNGLVIEVFNSENIAALKGNMAIGHVRMGDHKAPGIENIQPLLVRSHLGDFTVAHNGRIVNGDQLLSLIHISEPTRLRRISYAVFCLKKKKQ